MGIQDDPRLMDEAGQRAQPRIHIASGCSSRIHSFLCVA